MPDQREALACAECRVIQDVDDAALAAGVCLRCGKPAARVAVTRRANRPRLLFLLTCFAVGAAGVGALFVLNGMGFDTNGGPGAPLPVMIAFGLVSVGSIILLSYFTLAITPLLFGWDTRGFSWLTRRSVPDIPPDWYREPTFGARYWRECGIAVGVTVSALAVLSIYQAFRSSVG